MDDISVVGMFLELGSTGLVLLIFWSLRQDVRWFMAEILDILRDVLDIPEARAQAIKKRLD